MKNVYKNIFLISMHKLRFADVYFYICLLVDFGIKTIFRNEYFIYLQGIN